MHFRKRRLLKLPRIKSKTGCPEVDLLTEFHCIKQNVMQQMYINTKVHLFICSPRYSHAIGSKTNKTRKAKAYAENIDMYIVVKSLRNKFLVLKGSEI